MNDGNETQTSEEQQTQTEDTSLVNEQQTEQKTEEQQQQDDSKSEDNDAAAEESVAPLTAEALVIPEGLSIPDEAKGKFVELMNDSSMSATDKANALLNLQYETAKQAQEADSAAWTQTQKEWQDQVRADPELGGTKLQPALTEISKLMDEYGSSELRDLMDLTGAGNNVHMIRFLNKVAGQLNEGAHRGGSPNAASGEQTLEEKAAAMYPSMKKG